MDRMDRMDEVRPMVMSFAFCGPSGSGKSSLLKAYLGARKQHELVLHFCNKPFIAMFSDHPRYTMRRADAIGLSFMRVHLKVDEVLVRVLLGCAN